MKKLIVTALLAGMSISAYGEVYKCQVDGKTVYQQSPCAGQVDTAQPMNLNNSNVSVIYDSDTHYPTGLSSSRTYVHGYTRKNGTYVHGYTRRK